MQLLMWDLAPGIFFFENPFFPPSSISFYCLSLFVISLFMSVYRSLHFQMGIIIVSSYVTGKLDNLCKEHVVNVQYVLPIISDDWG